MVGDGRWDAGRGTHPLEVHALHRLVHALHHGRHVPRHLPHGHGGLDPAGNRVDPACEAQEVQGLVLLPDGVRGVYPRAIVVALLQSLRPGCIQTAAPREMDERGAGRGHAPS